MLIRFRVPNASWRGVSVSLAEAELHTAVVDGETCTFQIRWYSFVDGEPVEIRNAVEEMPINHALPLLAQLNAAFMADFPQATIAPAQQVGGEQ